LSQQQIMVVLGADVSDLSRAMAMVQTQVRNTANIVEREMNDVERSVKRSTKGISGHLKSMGASFGKAHLGMAKLGVAGGGLTSALSAVVPILASAVGGAGALGSAFMSAGIGVAGFGAVAVANLNDVFTATDETFGELSSAQQKAYKDLKGFKSFWGDFAKEFEQPTMDIFSKGVGALQTVLTAIKPAIQGTANAVNGLMDSLSTSLKSDDMMVFFDFINETAGGMVERFGQIFGNTFRGIANLMVGFAPLANEMMDGLVGMTEKFAEWSSAFRDSNGLQTFMDYVRTNAPVVMGIVGDILTTAMNLLIMLAPLGQKVLGVLGQVTGALSTFSDSFKNALSMGDSAGAGEAIANLVSSIISTLTSSIPQLIGAGMQLVSGLVTGIANNVPAIVQAVIGLIQAILTNIITNYPLIIDAGVKLLQGLVEGLVTALPQLLAMVTEIINMIPNLITTYLPMILQAGITLLMGVIQGLVTALPSLIQSILTLIQTILTTVVDNLPMILQAGIQVLNSLVEGILSMLPQLVDMILNLVTTIFDVLIENLPTIINAGIELLLALVNGIVKMLPELVNTAFTLIFEIVGALLERLPQIIEAGIEIIFALIDGLIEAIPELVGAIPEIVDAIFDAFGNVEWGDIGKEIINGIATGIGDFAGTLVAKGKEVAESALGGIKSFLGIHSPSRVFRDEVGKWIPQGIAVGIEKDADVATDAMDDVSSSLVLSGENVKLNGWMTPTLPQLDAKGYGGQTITNHYTINATIREDADIEKISRQIVKEQSRLERAGGRR
jgi:phage-related protein